MKGIIQSLISGGLMLASTGVFLTATTDKSIAGTLTYNGSLSSQTTNWIRSVALPKYNRSEQLLSIQVTATSTSSGLYTLQRTGSSNIRYGQFSDDVGASILVTGPNSSISLNPVPNQSIGTNTLTATNPSLSINTNGTDSVGDFVDSSFFNLYKGSGNVLFSADAESLIVVSKSGSPFSESASIAADLAVSITYTYADAPPATTPEPGTILGILAIAGTSLTIKRRQKNLK